MSQRPAGSDVGRRAVLRGAVAGVVVGLAGCAGGPEERGAVETEPNEGRRTGGSPRSVSGGGEAAGDGGETTEGGEPTTDDALDLREANAVAVEFEPRDGEDEFSVTLHHDDDGEDGYADWWQVETVDGERLGRRELRHAHGTAPFTRSAAIEVPDDVSCVVVRGHDQTHGYGGQAMIVDLATGATKPVRQGPDRRAFDRGDCP